MPQPPATNQVLGIPTYAQRPMSNVPDFSLPSRSYWTWVGTETNNPFPQYYFGNSPTKTGLLPHDLRDFAGVPLQNNSVTPSIPMSDTQLFKLLRQAEDWVETETGILLAQSWIASPPVSAAGAQSIGLAVSNNNPNGGQVIGVDYDLFDPGYDFFYRRFLMSGWGIQQLRYRPLKTVVNFSFIYPLLSEFFKIPRTWIVDDWDASILRIVPAANVQMLPLFAMQLAFMGFADSLPQGLYLQYIAGLNSVDYNTRFNFMKTLVLSQATIYALNIAQGSVNFGAIRQATSVDGLRYDVSYPNTGAAYGGIILSFKNQRDELLRTAIDLVRGTVAFVSL